MIEVENSRNVRNLYIADHTQFPNIILIQRITRYYKPFDNQHLFLLEADPHRLRTSISDSRR